MKSPWSQTQVVKGRVGCIAARLLDPSELVIVDDKGKKYLVFYPDSPEGRLLGAVLTCPKEPPEDLPDEALPEGYVPLASDFPRRPAKLDEDDPLRYLPLHVLRKLGLA